MSERGELDYVHAQVKAAESELEAAKVRAQAARMQVETSKSRFEVFQEQLEAAKAQVTAAQAQAQAAGAQREAATVQAEAAIAQVEAIREQAEAIKSQLVVTKTQTMTLEEQAETVKSQVALMRTQTDTLQEQLGAMRRQARGMSWIAALATVAALSLLALAGLSVYRFLNAPPVDRDATGRTAVAAEGEGEGGADRSGPGTVEPVDVDSRLAPIEAEQTRAREAVAALNAKIGLMASRVVEDTGATTKRIKVLSPPLGSGDGSMSWSTPSLAQWLAKGQRGAGEGRSTYDISGTVKRPVKPGQRITIDLFEDRWWPGGGSITVAVDGTWSGSVEIDPEAPPSRLRVTLWDLDQAAATVFAFSSEAGATASDEAEAGSEAEPAPPTTSGARPAAPAPSKGPALAAPPPRPVEGPSQNDPEANP